MFEPFEAKTWSVEEQIIEDSVSGLTFQFEVVPESTARFRLRIFGDLPLGNREILFDKDGKVAGMGSAVRGLSRPTWLCQIE
jgi:hypothetical protein